MQTFVLRYKELDWWLYRNSDNRYIWIYLDIYECETKVDNVKSIIYSFIPRIEHTYEICVIKRDKTARRNVILLLAQKFNLDLICF